MEHDLDLRYRIRANTQLLCARADLIYELSTQINAYLDNPSDTNSYKKAIGLLTTLCEMTNHSNKLTRELHTDTIELNKKLIIQ